MSRKVSMQFGKPGATNNAARNGKSVQFYDLEFTFANRSAQSGAVERKELVDGGLDPGRPVEPVQGREDGHGIRLEKIKSELSEVIHYHTGSPLAEATLTADTGADLLPAGVKTDHSVAGILGTTNKSLRQLVTVSSDSGAACQYQYSLTHIIRPFLQRVMKHRTSRHRCLCGASYLKSIRF